MKPKRTSAEDLRSGKVPLVKPWAKKSQAALKKALGSPSPRHNLSLSQKFDKIFNSGKLIRFESVLQRYDDDWHIRICWKIIENPSGKVIDSCDWFGFPNIEQCVDDCLRYLGK